MKIKTFVDGLPAIFPCGGLDEVFGWQILWNPWPNDESWLYYDWPKLAEGLSFIRRVTHTGTSNFFRLAPYGPQTQRTITWHPRWDPS